MAAAAAAAKMMSAAKTLSLMPLPSHKSTSPKSSDTELIKEVPSSDNEVEFFIKDTPNTHPIWTAALAPMKPYYIIMSDVYPESWGMGETLSKSVRN